MIQVDQITLREIRLPLKQPFRISSGVCTERRIVLLQLHDASGVETWSECVAAEMPNYTAETADTAWHAIVEWVAPRVLGVCFDGPAAVHPALQRDFRGHNMAKAAVEMGMWALAAEQERVPLARLVGGTRSEVETGVSLGIQDSPGALVQRASAARSAGYRKIKMKIQPGADFDFLVAVREALGADAPLMADANNAYTVADTARLQRLDELDLMMLEQPLASDDLLRHAQLQRVLRTPLCLDESITSADRAEDMIALGSGRIINIKAGRVGGFAQSIAIHDLCARHGIPVWCGGMLESGIGRAYNIAIASLPNFTKPGDLSPSAHYWARDIVIPEWTMDGNGRVQVPLDRIGIGVTVDRDRVDDLSVRVKTLKA